MALACITVGGQVFQVNDIKRRDHLTAAQAIQKFVVSSEDGFHIVGLQKFQTHRSEVAISVDTRVPVSPQDAAYHQVVQQREPVGIGVSLLQYSAAGMAGALLPAGRGRLVKVDRESSYSLRLYAHAGPYC